MKAILAGVAVTALFGAGLVGSAVMDMRAKPATTPVVQAPAPTPTPPCHWNPPWHNPCLGAVEAYERHQKAQEAAARITYDGPRHHHPKPQPTYVQPDAQSQLRDMEYEQRQLRNRLDELERQRRMERYSPRYPDIGGSAYDRSGGHPYDWNP